MSEERNLQPTLMSGTRTEENKVVCRYCGGQMRLSSAIDGDTVSDYYAWHQCMCGHRTPYGKGKMRAKAIEAAYLAATATPPNRALSLAQIKALDATDAVWTIQEDNRWYTYVRDAKWVVGYYEEQIRIGFEEPLQTLFFSANPTPADIKAARKERANE